MARGDRASQGLPPEDRRAIERAVDTAEERTGLQFCVYIGPSGENARAHAESMFVEAGLDQRPAVLVLVAPGEHRVEIVTAAEIRGRLTDEACARALDDMTPAFKEGRFAAGLERGLARLADEAGPGTAGPDDTELPDVIG